MEKAEEQQEIYQGRVERFMNYLRDINSDWINKRSWFEDLNNFELGDNFYYKVLFVDDTSNPPEDKSDFYFGILLYASINITKKTGPKQEHLKSGFEIESDLDDEFGKQEHESLLGFAWWLAIYKQAHKAKQFSAEEELELQKKRKELMKRFNRIESLD